MQRSLQLTTFLFSLSALAPAALAQISPSAEQVRQQDARSEAEWYYSVGIQNYVFALPLVIMERERKIRLDPAALEQAKKVAPAAPINQIGNMQTLATANDIMPYTPNNDTVYSGAFLELAGGPIILTAPDIADRYWSVEVADAYTNNLFYIGTRATGGKGGNHVFVGPELAWHAAGGRHRSSFPDQYRHVRHPHRGSSAGPIGSAKGQRPAGKIPPDLARQLGRSREIRPSRSPRNSPRARTTPAISPGSGPRPICSPKTRLHPIRKPPSSCSAAAASRWASRWISPRSTKPPMTASPVPSRSRPQIMKWKVKYRGTPYPTRWNNLRPGDYGDDYFDRAAGALEGLFVHDRAEAEYFSTYEDGNAHLLDGANNYILHFDKDQIPPTLKNGFWSFTMYGADFQLVKNPIDRFSIGDRTKGLTYNADGSLDIYIQHASPPGHEGNWLPSPPNGLFRINYRIYLPAKVAQDPATLGKYLPPIKAAS